MAKLKDGTTIGEKVAAVIEDIQDAISDHIAEDVHDQPQPPEEHGNADHSETFAVDGDEQPPESHGNQAHDETFAVDGDEQPPEEHGSQSHSSDVVHDGQNATLGDTTHDLVDTENVDISEGIKLPIKEEGDTAEEGEIAVSPDGTLLVAKEE